MTTFNGKLMCTKNHIIFWIIFISILFIPLLAGITVNTSGISEAASAKPTTPSPTPTPTPNESEIVIANPVTTTKDEAKALMENGMNVDIEKNVKIDKSEKLSEELKQKANAAQQSDEDVKTKQSKEAKAGEEISMEIVETSLDGGQTVFLGDKKAHHVYLKMASPELESSSIGNLNPKEINQVIQNNIGGIKYCYEKFLRLIPNLSGRIDCQFTITEDGSVSDVKVARSTLKNDDVAECFLSKLARMKFPPPRGGAMTITYPFVFAQSF